jgi:hypothetical protein
VQYVFGVHVAVGPAARSSERFDELTFEVVSWLTGRLGLAVENVDAGESERAGASATWSTSSGEAGRLRSFRVEHPDVGGRPLTWQVSVWVGEERDDSWIRARVGLRPTVDTQVLDPVVAVGTPRFIQSVVDRYGTTVDGLGLSAWSRVTTGGVDGYVTFLRDPDRKLPVVAVTMKTDGTSVIEPAVLASRLRGVAHVVCIDPDATYVVSDLVTPQLSCFGGAARIYWPGFAPDASPLSHPLWIPRTLMTADAVVDEVVARVGRAAALTYGPPRLEMVLRRESSAKAIAAARAERQAQAAERETVRQASGGLSAAEFADFSADFTALESRAEGYERRIEELELELELARDERERARDAERQAWAVVSESQRQQGPQLDSSAPASPNSVLGAVEAAAQQCSNLRFLQSAFESAAESQYSDPALVLSDLLLLDEIATMWVQGTMGADFRTVFRERHNGFRADISTTAATRYAEDYAIRYDGKTEQMGPHLRRGVGPPPTILGIYWFKDDDLKKLVIGHVGRKLRDDSNKN